MTGKNAPGDVTGGVFPFCGAKFGRKPGIPRYLLVARRRLVLGNQIGGHPTPVLNVISLLACPVTDLGGVQRGASSPAGPTCGATPAAPAAAHLPGVRDILTDGRAQLFRVLGVQVDLVIRTVERKAHGPLCCSAIDVVDEESLY